MSSLADRTKEFKRDQRAAYVLRPGFLDAEQRKQLHRLIPHDSPAETMHVVERGLQRGEFEQMDIFQDGRRVGFTVFVENEEDAGKEMLSICTYADGENVTGLAMPLLEDVARSRGSKTMRLHTMRTGLVEKLRRSGWFVSEIVMRKELT